MINKKRLFELFAVLFCFAFSISIAYSSEMMVSADRSGGFGADFVLYYTQSKQDIDIETSSQEQISVLNLPAAISTFSYTGTGMEKYELNKNSKASVLKFSKRFGQKLHPYLKFGILKTELRGYGSKWESGSDGALFGGGLKYVLLQDTVVTPAIAVNAGINYENTEIKKINMSESNLKLKTNEIETSFLASKKIRAFEGWAGLQLSWLNGDFEGTDVNATSTNILFGLSYGFLKNVGITVEISLINLKDTNFCSGIKMGF